MGGLSAGEVHDPDQPGLCVPSPCGLSTVLLSSTPANELLRQNQTERAQRGHSKAQSDVTPPSKRSREEADEQQAIVDSIAAFSSERRDCIRPAQIDSGPKHRTKLQLQMNLEPGSTQKSPADQRRVIDASSPLSPLPALSISKRAQPFRHGTVESAMDMAAPPPVVTNATRRQTIDSRLCTASALFYLDMPFFAAALKRVQRQLRPKEREEAEPQEEVQEVAVDSRSWLDVVPCSQVCVEWKE